MDLNSKITNKAALIWAIADKITGVYKPHEYGKVILPLTVIKRFDSILEETKSDASESGASTANLVQLGSFELWNGTTADRSLDPTYWSYDASKATPGTDGAWEGYSMYIPGAITDKRRASQTITINKSSDSTYILSGWAQAYSAPNCTPATDMKGDNSEGKRFFGLIAKVSYTDTSLAPDYHYVTFDCNYTGWQYASGSVVPKQRGKTVSTITITTAYDYNINVGHFDDISLVEEPAQTYTYDEKGNLKATTSTGNSDENFKYNGADLIKQTAGGYGSYTYDYDSAHNMTKATNDNVSVTATYDGAGNSTGTRLQKSGKAGVYLQTSATYTANQDHTASVTDANGGTTTFGYDSLGRNTSTSTPIDTGVTSTTSYTYVSGTDWQYRTSNSAGGVLYYGYTNGVQTEASRYSSNSQARPWQRYHLTLDAWGNTTKIQVQSGTGTTVTSWLTGPTLASYEYAGNNGYLSKMTNANGDYETYTYDRYGRIVTIEHRTKNGTLNYTEVYVYDGNGNTGRCKVMDGSGNVTDDYRYEYDSLGRLIRSSQVSDGETVLRTEHIYDADNRLTNQSYQLGASSFSESYEYNKNDGSMKSMDTANGDTLSFTYDAIKRLESVAAGSRYTKTYGYRTISGSQTTTQISSLAYSGFTGAPTYRYAYTANGNIKSVQNPNGSSTTYTYDTQGQLITAVDEDWATTFHYTYDTAGNILTKNAWRQYGDNEEIAYSYDNASWPDLLTAVNGQRIAYEGQTFNPNTGAVSGTVKSGNPISYFNGDTRWNFTWENGRQLATAFSSEGNTDTTIDYAYDLNGYRTSKTVVTKTYETVPVHNYVTTVAAATCTEGGYTLHECACGDSYRTDETAALGHNYVESGLETYTCTRCGDTYTDHTHSYTTTVVEPTCTEDGYTLHACACGYSYRDNVVSKLGHRYIVIAEDGENATYRCTRCGHTYTSPISIIDPPNPPVSQYSLGDEATTTGCGSERVLKSTVTEEHSYIYAGGRLLRETITTTAANGTVTTKVLDFAYDAQGTPYSLTYTNGTASPATYYYVTNLQGDVTYLINSGGTKVASYSYDPYGQIQQTTGSMAQINPLRYRGYYYDSETGFYYLQSRYYDPQTCRFINADSYSSTGQGILGYNMFAYCNNNPVVQSDHNGEFDLLTLVSAVISAAVNVATTYIAAKATGQEYTLTDALVSAAIGAANAIPVAGPFIAGGISGAYSAYTAVKNGATAGEAALCFAVSATVTTASIGNLANLGTESALSIVATASADLVFGTGYNCIAAATNKAVSMKAEERKASGTQTTSTTRSRNTQKRGNKRTGYTMCLY